MSNPTLRPEIIMYFLKSQIGVKDCLPISLPHVSSYPLLPSNPPFPSSQTIFSHTVNFFLLTVQKKQCKKLSYCHANCTSYTRILHASQILYVISYLDPKTFYILFITYKSHYCCLQAKDMIPCKSLECLRIVWAKHSSNWTVCRVGSFVSFAHQHWVLKHIHQFWKVFLHDQYFRL